MACFSGNPRLQARLLRIRFIREHVENYRNRTGLPRRNLVISLTFLWTMLILSMVLLRKLWVLLLLAAVGVAVTVHILCIARPNRREAGEGTGKRRGNDGGRGLCPHPVRDFIPEPIVGRPKGVPKFYQ